MDGKALMQQFRMIVLFGIYNRARYETEKREALDRWALHLINLSRTLLG